MRNWATPIIPVPYWGRGQQGCLCCGQDISTPQSPACYEPICPTRPRQPGLLKNEKARWNLPGVILLKSRLSCSSVGRQWETHPGQPPEQSSWGRRGATSPGGACGGQDRRSFTYHALFYGLSIKPRGALRWRQTYCSNDLFAFDGVVSPGVSNMTYRQGWRRKKKTQGRNQTAARDGT